MRPTPIGSRPRRELGHRLPSRDWDTWFDLYPLPIDRPPAGRTRADVVCGTCGAAVTVTVSSATELRSARRHGLTYALALALMALAVTGVAAWGAWHGWDPGRTLFVWLVPPLLLYAAHPLYRDWHRDDGTELTDPSDPAHTLRDPPRPTGTPEIPA